MAAMMGLTLLVLLVQDVPLAFWLRQVETDRLTTALERDAFVLAGRSEELLENPSDEAVEALAALAREYRDQGGARVVIVDATGTAVVTSDDDQTSLGTSYASRPEIQTALSGSIATGHRYSATLGEELTYVAVPVLSGDHVHGAVRLTYPEQVIIDAVTVRLEVLGIVALTSALLAGLVGYVFSSTVTRRLRLLESVTDVLAGGDLGARADDRTGAPEIRALSRSFNTMADRLQTMVDQQRAFAGDASHQLRTPLTALRLRLEAAREIAATDPDAAIDRIAAAEAEADRLLTIVEGLLRLTRLEASAAPRTIQDVAAVARERVEHWQALAQELGVELRYSGPQSARALALEHAVEHVIDNYVDNALGVSPPDSTIDIVVTPDGQDVTLSVSDRGPGLAADQLEHAFDRFWQADSGRGGSGLGLAIVRGFVEAGGGTVHLEPRPGGGLTAIARFVVAPGVGGGRDEGQPARPGASLERDTLAP